MAGGRTRGGRGGARGPRTSKESNGKVPVVPQTSTCDNEQVDPVPSFIYIGSSKIPENFRFRYVTLIFYSYFSRFNASFVSW